MFQALASAYALTFAVRALQRQFSQIERHAGCFLAEGCLSRQRIREAPRQRLALCAEIEPHLGELTAAFGLDNAVLSAPIAEDDYVDAYAGYLRPRLARATPSQSQSSLTAHR